MIATIGQLLRRLRADPARSPLAASGFDAPRTIMVSSPEFVEGGRMPISSAGHGVGDNVSPELNWTGIPEGTQQVVLILDDVDVPLRTPLIHSLAILDAGAKGLAAGAFTSATTRIVPTMLSKQGYAGPRPIPGHGPHRYRFHLLALDCPLPADTPSVPSVLQAASGHVIARGTLTGHYER
jgi:Raf kinase inhibitor-like YbhB/YbcL family protein